MDFTRKNLLHTPEGVRDIYGNEYKIKLHIEELLHEKFKLYGYDDIQTPSFEFFDVFSREVGTTPSRELYKFFDKEGNTLVLRPDFTPSIARCAAKYFMDESLPLRFSYLGNNFINISELQGKLRETTQMGAELIGDASAASDAEMISLLVEALLNAGLKEFQVSIGQIDYFKGLCKKADLDEETELNLREFISNRNTFGAEELLLGKGVSKEDVDALLVVTDLFGSYEILDEADKYANNEKSKNAILRLRQVYEACKEYGVEKYISFDLAMISKYNYYTGVIFNAYTYQAGSPIAKGGRYDTLLTQFGKTAAATGFVINVDDFLNALRRQQLTPVLATEKVLLVFTDESKAINKAKELRNKNIPVALVKKDKGEEYFKAYALENNFKEIIFVD